MLRTSSPRRLTCFVALLFSLALGLATTPESGIRAADPDLIPPTILPASNEGELAKSAIKAPQGMRIDLFAAEPMIANPVAFGFDSQGRVYVCETFRQQTGVEDNRNHMVWLEDDLAARSVADRIAMFRKHLGEQVQEYARRQDRIRRLEDTNGDGRADLATVFAGPFHQIEEGTGAGVIAVNGDVFYTNIPKLWRLRDTDGDGSADEQTALADGFGVRVAFRGHDMHGLTLGPDGRLYFSIGDRGYNVTTAEGSRLVRPDTGAVFRCELDGSDLKVFAYGLRNPQELAFDDFGNLFTGDNNSDSGDQARWVHVVEGADSGWRMYFQYLADRGPWNRERMWFPYRHDEETARKQPAYIVPPVANLADGPSGLVYYPGVGLPERYRGHFLMADFRGSTSRSGVRAFAVEPRGATFQLNDSHWFIENLLATDVDFGYDGKVYVSDWVDGWNGPGKGRLYTFTDESQQDAVRKAGVPELFSAGFEQLESEDLAKLLQHADRRVRQAAHLALAKKGDVATLARIVLQDGPQLGRLHALWGLWCAGRRQMNTTAIETVRSLAKDSDSELRAQAYRILGEIGDATDLPLLRSAIADNDAESRERCFAAIAMGRIPPARPADADPNVRALVSLLRDNNDRDPVLRHAAVMGLVGQASPSALGRLELDQTASVRLGAVLALRRLHSAEIARFLTDSEPRIVEEAARAIHDEPIAAALPSLAALASQPAESLSDALARRVLNANYRLGGPRQALAIANWAIADSTPQHLRDEALFTLEHWDAPPALDRVTNEHRPLPARSRNAATPAVVRLCSLLSNGSAELRAQVIQLAAAHGLRDLEPELSRLGMSEGEPAVVRAAAIAALASLGSEAADEAVAAGVAAKAEEVRLAAYRAATRLQLPGLVDLLSRAVSRDRSTLRERQAAVKLLGECADREADSVLASLLTGVIAADDSVPAGICLDVVTAARSRGTPAMTSLLTAWDQSQPADDPLAPYRLCLEGGDAERGKDIFFGNAAASCRRCHKVAGEGSDVGPDLSGVARTNPRDYLLESIVNPNAKIAKGFETVIFVMDDGRVVTGLVKGEDATTYRLMTSQGEIVPVEKQSIEDRAAGKSGMPEDAVKSLSKSDVRDLVEYLSTLQAPAATDTAHGHAVE